MDPRIEFVARSIFRADKDQQKPASWESAGANARNVYVEHAMAAVTALTRFDAQRSGCSLARGPLRSIRTVTQYESGNMQQATIEIDVPWWQVKHWSLGIPVDVTVPLTHRGQSDGDWKLYEGDPARDMGELFLREFQDAQRLDEQPAPPPTVVEPELGDSHDEVPF